MLAELRITNLGVIEDLHLVLPPGSVAITGETGAGKTMIVGAIQLLLGARAEPDMVRVDAAEAVVEGRFIEADGTEIVAKRVVPADGRSRAYLDGSLATATALGDRLAPLVDLHGQHAQQSLLRPATQRAALDRFGEIDRTPLLEARATIRTIDAALADLGGDETARARQIDLLQYQLDELTAAALDDPAEDETLAELEATLAGAYDHQQAAAQVADVLGSEGAVADGLGTAAATLDGLPPFDDVSGRLRVLQDELAALVADVRAVGEAAIDDPEQRAAVRARRQLLVELRRKYGPTLEDVIDYRAALETQLAELHARAERVEELTARRGTAVAELDEVESRILAERQAAADPLARAVELELASLAMPHAQVTIGVDGPAGDEVAILLAANPGLPSLPIGKGASGGELSRIMLALRLVVAGGPPVKVFDEVDAGIGGEAARAVGEALAAIGSSGQAFVVTHLPQVAARADHHVRITKSIDDTSTSSQAVLLDDADRVVEVSRLLSGSPDSSSAREHAEELLAGDSR